MTTAQIANLLGLDCNEVATIICETGIGADLLDKPSFADYFREMCEQTCYQPILPKLNYAERLTEVESLSTNAIRERYSECLQDAEKDYKKLTELCLIVNWLSWYHHEAPSNHKLAAYYGELFYDCDEYAFDILHGEELDYFIRTLD